MSPNVGSYVSTSFLLWRQELKRIPENSEQDCSKYYFDPLVPTCPAKAEG